MNGSRLQFPHVECYWYKGANSFPPESTRLSSSVTGLGSVVECCPPHKHLCREGRRGGEAGERERFRSSEQ